MRLLLDTHALLWWLAGDPLEAAAGAAIADPENQVLVSAASIWEITIKRSIGKLAVDGSVDESAMKSGFDRLPVLAAHAEGVGELPALHRDPFDRMLIAQARVEQLVLVTRDERIAQFDVDLLRC